MLAEGGDDLLCKGLVVAAIVMTGATTITVIAILIVIVPDLQRLVVFVLRSLSFTDQGVCTLWVLSYSLSPKILSVGMVQILIALSSIERLCEFSRAILFKRDLVVTMAFMEVDQLSSGASAKGKW